MTYVNRNPFARQETHRAFEVGQSCDFCGIQSLRSKRSYPLGLGSYRYRVETDGGRTYQDRETFCSMSCRRAYNS